MSFFSKGHISRDFLKLFKNAGTSRITEFYTNMRKRPQHLTREMTLFPRLLLQRIILVSYIYTYI